MWSLILLLGLAGSLWLDVPFVKQEKNGCGSASVWMVLEYWRQPASPAVEDIHRELYSPSAGGVYADDMERYFQSRGFRTFVFNGEWKDLEQHVAQGRPLIVCLERNARGTPLHYVVVAGVDSERDLVLLNDPAQRKLLAMDRKEFEQAWSLIDNWTLLALPESEAVHVDVPVRPEAPANPSELEAASTAFRQENFSAAKRYLHSALRRNSDHAFTNDFLASLYFLDDNLEAALKYWNRANKPLLRDVRIDPPSRTNPVLMDHAFAFSRAGVLTLESYRKTVRTLDAMGVYSRYRFELSPTDTEEFDLTVHANENHGPNFLSWLSGLPYQTLYPQWLNVGGRALNVHSLLRWDANKRRAFLQVSAPIRDDPSLKYRISFDLRDENWDYRGESFGLHKGEVQAEIARASSDRWSWVSGAKLSRRRFSNTFSEGTALSYRGSSEYVVFRLPEQRLVVGSSINAEFGKLLSGPSSRYAKVEPGFSFHWFPQTRGQDYETTARLRAGKIFGQPPFDELFVAGLDRDHDLWLRAHPATTGGRKGAGLVGSRYFISSFDTKKIVWDTAFVRLGLGPFLDTGRVSSDPRWLFDTGLQLRISILSTFAFNISYGKNLRTGEGVLFSNTGH